MVLQNALIWLIASKVIDICRSDPCPTMAIKMYRAAKHRVRTRSSSANGAAVNDANHDDDSAAANGAANHDDDDDDGAANEDPLAASEEHLYNIAASIEALRVGIHADLDAMEEV